MIVWSNYSSITSDSGQIIFCCGCHGLGCPKSRYWKPFTLFGERIIPRLRDV